MMWFFLSLAIISELAGTISLRASDSLKRKLWLVAIVPGYLLSFVFLSVALSEGLPLGVGYGIWVACGVALTAVSARILFGDPLTLRMAFGVLLIATGVLLVELGTAAR
ncbi:SMR family transporter [Glutamicibacter nicotianae]|uniref:Cation transporter n=2 Tax=Glutamicibacter nicotianae TaxID=37929 RepID=A0ABQ0RQJ7_GLUNI|nr:cation transporter [Glutamicibacter nicotianae]